MPEPTACGQVTPPTAQRTLLLPLPGGRPIDQFAEMEARARDRAASERAEREAAEREAAGRDALIKRAAELLVSGGHAEPSRARALAALGMSLAQADSRVCDAAAGRAELSDSDLLALVIDALVTVQPTSAAVGAGHG